MVINAFVEQDLELNTSVIMITCRIQNVLVIIILYNQPVTTPAILVVENNIINA